MGTLRTILEINLFALRTLQARSWWGITVAISLLALGAWLAARDLGVGAWLSFAAGVAGLGREAWTVLGAARAPSTVRLETDHRFVQRLPFDLQPSEEETRDGFMVVHEDLQPGQAVVRCAGVDAWLRVNPVAMQESTHKRREVDQLLRDHAAHLETLLRCKARKSLGSVPRRLLVNERKLGLTDGISPSRPAVRVHPVGYFHSVVTNEASTRYLETMGADPTVVFSGPGHLFPVDRREEGVRVLLPLAHSRMSDHIGVSTLVVTRDRKLVFWSQGLAAQQSRNQYVSTGSGSCNWSDRVAGDLKATVAAAMEREFLEESFGGKAAPAFDRRTRVLGYFRWLSRAGKPEFTGVTCADIDSHQLSPNIREVDRRDRNRLCRDVPSLARLTQVVDELLDAPRGSVSFRMNLLALREAIAESPEDWSEFLRLPGA